MQIPGFSPSEEHGSSFTAGAEALLGILLPQLYKELLAKYSGVSGEAVFPVRGSEHPGTIGCWLSLSPWDQESLWTVLSSCAEHQLPREIVPFGETGGGDYICFDYRAGVEPSVAIWYHELIGEEGLYQLASSFGDFLHSLHEPEPDA